MIYYIYFSPWPDNQSAFRAADQQRCIAVHSGEEEDRL